MVQALVGKDGPREGSPCREVDPDARRRGPRGGEAVGLRRRFQQQARRRVGGLPVEVLAALIRRIRSTRRTRPRRVRRGFPRPSRTAPVWAVFDRPSRPAYRAVDVPAPPCRPDPQNRVTAMSISDYSEGPPPVAVGARILWNARAAYSSPFDRVGGGWKEGAVVGVHALIVGLVGARVFALIYQRSFVPMVLDQLDQSVANGHCHWRNSTRSGLLLGADSDAALRGDAGAHVVGDDVPLGGDRLVRCRVRAGRGSSATGSRSKPSAGQDWS